MLLLEPTLFAFDDKDGVGSIKDWFRDLAVGVAFGFDGKNLLSFEVENCFAVGQGLTFGRWLLWDLRAFVGRERARLEQARKQKSTQQRA